MVLECRGCNRAITGLAAFCQSCLDLPEDLPGVTGWRPKVVRAICLKDRLRVAAIQRIVAYHKHS